MRWGLGDFVWAWVAGNVGALVTVSLALAGSGGDADELSDIAALVAGMVGQVGGTALAVWLLVRAKGTGRPARDLGLVVHARDWWWLLVGVGLAVGNGLLVAPLAALLDQDEPAQEVVRVLQDSSGPLLPLAAFGVAVLFPVLEEVLYRGLLLRSLARRTSTAWAVAVSSALFGVVHLVGNLEAAILLVGLTGLGVVSAYQAARTGDLSRSILLHVGFNLLAAVALLAGV